MLFLMERSRSSSAVETYRSKWSSTRAPGLPMGKRRKEGSQLTAGSRTSWRHLRAAVNSKANLLG